MPRLHGRRRPAHPHGRHDGRAQGRGSHARQPARQRRGVHRMGARPARGRRGLLLHPAPLPRLRVHDRFPGGPAPGGDRRHVPEVRHRPGPGRPAPTPLHVLPGRAPHVRAPAGGSRGHGRGPVLHPLLPVGRDAPVGASGPKMGGGDRRPHDRRLRHDRGIPDPPRFPPGLLAGARGAGYSLPLHAGAHRRPRGPRARRRGRRGRRAHRNRPAGLLRVLESGRGDRGGVHRRRLAAHGRPGPGARRLYLHGGPTQGDDQLLRL